MNDCKNPRHPIFTLLDDLFAMPDISDVIAEYQRKNLCCDRWLMFSDYCLDDKNKANDVMTFVLMPFLGVEDFTGMQTKIHDLQPSDIKNSSMVNKDLLSYLKSESVLTFSFVLDDRKHFLAQSHDQCLKVVKETLQTICNCYEGWKETAAKEEDEEHFSKVVKTINRQLASLDGKNPDIKLLNDILITAFLGAYVSVKVLEKLPIKIFGWFSDRDKVISGKDNIIMPIFNFYQYNMLGGRQYQLVTFTPDDTVKPFYDDFNRIADMVAGALSDYNMDKNYITADKFNTVLVDFLADNKKSMIFHIHKTDDKFRVGQITMHPK